MGRWPASERWRRVDAVRRELVRMLGALLADTQLPQQVQGARLAPASSSLPSRRIGSMTLSITVNSASRKWNWTTKPSFSRRRLASSSSP